MLVVNVKGGLGNQMFQYAIYTQLQRQGKLVFLDYSKIAGEMKELNRTTIFDDFVLDRDYHVHRMEGFLGKLQSRFLIRVFRKLTRRFVEKEESRFDPNAFELKLGYLDGYWQSERYFEGCEGELRKRFQFKKELSAENEQILKKIRSTECPVSIHVRLGDYNTSENSALFGNICTQAYYDNAVKHIANKYQNPTFFVFSNEPQKAVEILNIPSAVIVDVNDEKSAWSDMYLMSQCHHNIIANSSFSWWGAWLNENKDKVVIAPQRWLNTKEAGDICPKSWIRV